MKPSSRTFTRLLVSLWMIALAAYVTLMGVSRPLVRIPDETQRTLYDLYAIQAEIEVAERRMNVEQREGECPGVAIRMAAQYGITEHTLITVLDHGLRNDWGDLICVPTPLVAQNQRPAGP